ncbi:DUF1840 family protein [uncultured Piscinibacter sp.]|uniref:DUF1840 family protein n=1 Tax=uncultured Piscinibacter sp. TaxID=1131835 RepID=UPI0026210BAE|nr:DUF1840 family protein [uncultured Piscinibacter sp.]
MIYKSQCKATGDVLMLGLGGDEVPRAMGIALATRGVIEPAARSVAIEAIEAAVARDSAAQDLSGHAAREGAAPPEDGGMTLRQRAWPLTEMIKRAQAARKPIVTGT